MKSLINLDGKLYSREERIMPQKAVQKCLGDEVPNFCLVILKSNETKFIITIQDFVEISC